MQDTFAISFFRNLVLSFAIRFFSQCLLYILSQWNFFAIWGPNWKAPRTDAICCAMQETTQCELMKAFLCLRKKYIHRARLHIIPPRTFDLLSFREYERALPHSGDDRTQFFEVQTFGTILLVITALSFATVFAKESTAKEFYIEKNCERIYCERMYI